MSLRFRLFRAFTLPSMVEVTRLYPSFLYIVIISANLPMRWKSLLLLLSLGKPWFKIVTLLPDDTLASAARRVIAEQAGGSRIFNFRFDDDDALAPAGFIDAILSHAYCPDHVVISFDDGFNLMRVGRDCFRLEARHRVKSAQGMGLFTRGATPTIIYELGNHNKVDQLSEVIGIRGGPYWIRTVHDHSWVGRKMPKQVEKVARSDVVVALAPIFAHLKLAQALGVMPIQIVPPPPDTTMTN